MPKNENQKLKILYVAKILDELSDEEHPISTNDILEYLQKNGILAERKSIYDDIKRLIDFGYDIEKCKGGYYIASRRFELAELKLLVQAVESSQFITHKKSQELIKKLESAASIHEARQLQHQLYLANRVKTANESIYYNIDKLHTAVSRGKKITFKYFEWVIDYNAEKRFVKRQKHNGRLYNISPWALTWNDDKLYLIGFDSENQTIKHYRVDKMQSIDIINEPRDGKEFFDSFDTAMYSNKIFSMYGGKEETVTLAFANNLLGVVIDRFGDNLIISKKDDEHFLINVKVQVSPQFFAWIFGLGDEAEIISPKAVADDMKEHTKAILSLYS